MSPAEIGAHVRKKIFQFSDARPQRDWAEVPLESSAFFPRLPGPAAAPALLREALQRDVADILNGRWKAFGYLEIKVDDPPQWHTDYLAGKDLTTNESAFNLNHRELPGGADIKMIWELSRWQQLVRLAQAAYVLDDARAAQTCVRWLKDWVTHNPPYGGWNWTSALEAGMRLMQFTWIDALLAPQGLAWGYEAELKRLRHEILPAHVWLTWRHKSFGSSANNHLLGELAGLILATVRWPALAQWGAPLNTLQRRWEHEVLAQFAEDGGNREQALNYQLFSWELCWQSRAALLSIAKKISPPVEDRLSTAARFFWGVQARRDPWDYGDSDNAFATPFFVTEQTALLEWRDWLRRSATNSALEYWLGDPPIFTPRLGLGQPLLTVAAHEWWIYRETGMAICESGSWWLRWDLSPLGYLSTAAHGHLDALHLSIWFKGVAMIIDPGTGAYYADEKLRSWLASPKAHNGPCPVGEEYPKRLGPFLWAEHHPHPTWKASKSAASGLNGLVSELPLPAGVLRRCITRLGTGDAWQVDDEFEPKAGAQDEFTVRWQFAPGSWIKQVNERKFSLHRADDSIMIQLSPDWTELVLVENGGEQGLRPGVANEFEGVVSPAFRTTVFAPYLKLTARPGKKPCVFRTTFLASEPS